MELPSDIILEILDLLGNNFSDLLKCSFISPEWEKLVHFHIEKNLTVWQILFQDLPPLPTNPMPDSIVGVLKDKREGHLYVENVEKWLKNLGDRRPYNKKCVVKYSKILKDKWEEICRKDATQIFIDTWKLYFCSLKIRIQSVIPLYMFLGCEVTGEETRAQNFLMSIRINDKYNEKVTKKLVAKDWICWEPILDGGEIDGYEFKIDDWKNLEKIRSFFEGGFLKPPNFPYYVPGYVSDVYGENSALIISMIKNIKMF